MARGDDELSGDDQGGPSAADRLDGGANRTAAGDICHTFRRDTETNCAR